MKHETDSSVVIFRWGKKQLPLEFFKRRWWQQGRNGYAHTLNIKRWTIVRDWISK